MDNTPILSPWLIYLAEKANVVIFISAIISILAMFTYAFLLEGWENGKFRDENGNKCVPDLCRKMFCIGTFCVLIVLFLPGTQTTYKMIIASYVTPANIVKTEEAIEDRIERLIDFIDRASEKLENRRSHKNE